MGRGAAVLGWLWFAFAGSGLAVASGSVECDQVNVSETLMEIQSWAQQIGPRVGNSFPDFQACLEQSARSDDPDLSARAAWALGEIGAVRQVALLRQLARESKDPYTRWKAIEALGKLSWAPEALQALSGLSQKVQCAERWRVVEALGKAEVNIPNAVKVAYESLRLPRCTEAENISIKRAAARTLGNFGSHAAVAEAELRRLSQPVSMDVESQSWQQMEDLRVVAIESLGEVSGFEFWPFGESPTLNLLTELSREDNDASRAAVQVAYKKIVARRHTGSLRFAIIAIILPAILVIAIYYWYTWRRRRPVFISFRKDDTQAKALGGMFRLAKWHKYSIFMSEWDEERRRPILERLQREASRRNSVVIALIGPDWLMATQRERETDFVEQELSRALKANASIRIVTLGINLGDAHWKILEGWLGPDFVKDLKRYHLRHIELTRSSREQVQELDRIVRDTRYSLRQRVSEAGGQRAAALE